MKQLLLICAAVVLVGCVKKEESKPVPLTKEESAKIIEAAIREELKKPTGELTQADLEKVMMLELNDKQLTSVKDLEKLTQLKKQEGDWWDVRKRIK